MEGFANSGKRNKSDHKTAERDLLEEEAWQRDIANVANALSPLMVFTFMWAGCSLQRWPENVLRDASDHVIKPHGEVWAEALFSIAATCLVFNVLARGKFRFMRRNWEFITSLTIILIVALFMLMRATMEVRGAKTPEGFVSPHVRFSLVFGNGSFPFPPRTSCVDTDPWMTAQHASPMAMQNEDAGCEGRYNSGFVCAGNISYIVFLTRTRIPWRYVALTVVCCFVCMSLGALAIGAHDRGLSRQLSLLVCTGILTAMICEARRSLAASSKEAIARIVVMAERSSDLLATLIPPEVVEAATHTDPDPAHPESGDQGSKGQSMEVGGGLQLTAKMDWVLVMFCVISPPLDTCSSSEAFELLSRVFITFDREVKRVEMFKYHHFQNTFLVASPSAALRQNVFANRQHEVETMLTLGLRLKELAAGFTTPDGRQLSLGVGLTAGPMVGRIVGEYRSYWSLFGDAINLSARLAVLSTKAEWQKRCNCMAGVGAPSKVSSSCSLAGWEQDPVGNCVACSMAVSDHMPADERSPAGLYVYEDVGDFDIKGKGETRVLAARLAPHVRDVDGIESPQGGAANGDKQRPHAWMAASTSMTQAISQAPGSASSHSNAKLEGSQASQVSTTSRFVKITAKRMREHQADGVAGGGLYQLPNNVVLELPSAAWLTRKTRDLAWSRRWLSLKKAREHGRFIQDCYSADQHPILCGFLFSFVVIAVNGDGVLALERFSVAPLDAHKRLLRLIYGVLMLVCLSGVSASIGLGRYIQHRRRSEGGRDEGVAAAEEGGLDESSAVAARLLRWLLITLHLAFLLFSVYIFRLSHASGWTLHYPFIQMQAMVQSNGLTFRQNLVVMASAAVILLPNIIGPKPRPPDVIIGISHLVGVCMAFTTVRNEAAGKLSEWLMLQLITKQKTRLREICCSLLPRHMVNMVLAVSHEPLPMTIKYKSKACVLQLDLVNYTSLTASCDALVVASHVQVLACDAWSFDCRVQLFLKFDALVSKSEGRCGAFKVDTIGDAYVVAAWLKGDEGGDRRNSGTKRQNAEVLRDMVGLATDLVAIVKSVQGLEVACRAGISQGEVCAGMLGLLQPRFQLIGEAMHRAAECEQKATIGTVHASQDVLTEIQAFEGGQMASGGEHGVRKQSALGLGADSSFRQRVGRRVDFSDYSQ